MPEQDPFSLPTGKQAIEDVEEILRAARAGESLAKEDRYVVRDPKPGEEGNIILDEPFPNKEWKRDYEIVAAIATSESSFNLEPEVSVPAERLSPRWRETVNLKAGVSTFFKLALVEALILGINPSSIQIFHDNPNFIYAVLGVHIGSSVLMALNSRRFS